MELQEKTLTSHLNTTLTTRTEKELFLTAAVLSGMGTALDVVRSKMSDGVKQAEASAAQLAKVAVIVARATLRQLEDE